MKKKNKIFTKRNMIKAAHTVGAAFLLSGIVALAGIAGTFDRQAESKNYELAGIIYPDGTIETEDGNVWVYETDSLIEGGWKSRDGEISFDKRATEKEIKTDGTLVYVRINDNGTDDVIDDYITNVGYDIIGECQKLVNECSKTVARNEELLAKIGKGDAEK